MRGDPTRMAVRHGGGRLLVVGAPIMLVGTGTLVAAFTGAFANERGWGAPAVPLGVVLSAAGAVLALLRWGYVVDVRTRTLIRWWGFPFPLARRSASLEGVTRVALSREFHLAGGGRGARMRVSYPIRLEGLDAMVDVEAPRDLLAARDRAETLARALGLEMLDSTSGEPVVRKAETIGESLREQSRRVGAPPSARPDRPPPARLSVDNRWGETTVEIPAPGLHGAEFVAVAVPVAVAIPAFVAGVLLMIVFLMQGRTPFAGHALVVGSGVFLTFALATSVRAARIAAEAWRIRRLRVWRGGVMLEVEGPVSKASRELASAEIEAVDIVAGIEEVGPGRILVSAQARLVVRSSRTRIEFGRGLSNDELEWLCDTVRFILTS